MAAVACGAVSAPIFVPEGDLLVPQPCAAGPWFPGVVHGGAITGAFARAVEAVPAAGPMVTTRLSVDMTRKVPLAPAMVEPEVVRDGRRVQAVECRYVVGGEVVARATATRIRIDHDVVPEAAEIPDPSGGGSLPGPGEVPEIRIETDMLDFVGNFTMRRTEPAPGTAITWVRLETAFVAGESTSPGVLLAIAADMIPSAGSVVDFRTYLSINPDLSITVNRLPVGEWIGSRAATHVQRGGHGQTVAALHDETGEVGQSVKSLLIDRR